MNSKEVNIKNYHVIKKSESILIRDPRYLDRRLELGKLNSEYPLQTNGSMT
jgi:hypothetical protein